MAENYEKSASTTLTAHGDGTYHSTSGDFGGKRVEHPSIGHALMHLARRHSTGDHLHVHANEDGITTHHVHEGERVKGPHDQANMRDLKRSISKFLNEESEED